MSDSVTVARIPDCDICKSGPIQARITPAIVDGKTTMGPWANMCEQHFDQYGVGLGTGKGQRFILEGSQPDPGVLNAIDQAENIGDTAVANLLRKEAGL